MPEFANHASLPRLSLIMPSGDSSASYGRPSASSSSSSSSCSSSTTSSSACDSDSASSASSTTTAAAFTMDSSGHPPVASVQVLRCMRCARAVETTTTDDIATAGMVRISHNLYYCERCAKTVGYK
ncbi:hypothetical protein V2A60_004378 [Cordyceps javanica]|uniref:SSCRP protein n=1 Tax=Cordyceps javanica TaxID=43265 RepID=A0A545VR01_9HYPO|nr:hypothetical protein IF1G_09145 [Cordyceps javanica]TQW04136.1 hypothetical protein IF2G_08450 [Cordyceps javanica]